MTCICFYQSIENVHDISHTGNSISSALLTQEHSFGKSPLKNIDHFTGILSTFVQANQFILHNLVVLPKGSLQYCGKGSSSVILRSCDAMSACKIYWLMLILNASHFETSWAIP